MLILNKTNIKQSNQTNVYVYNIYVLYSTAKIVYIYIYMYNFFDSTVSFIYITLAVSYSKNLAGNMNKLKFSFCFLQAQ